MSGRPATTDRVPGQFALSVGLTEMPAPKGWRWVKLTNVARLESGHTPSRNHDSYWNGDIPWIGIKDARDHNGRRILDTIQTVTPAGIENSAARLLPAGTVCLSRTASVGYSLVMGREMATSQDFVNWVCSEDLHPEFLMHLFLAERESLLRFAKGTVHKTIYFPEAKALHVCIPAPDEQRRIVAAIESHFSRLDAATATLERVQRNLERYRASVLKAAVEGRLVPTEAELAKMEGRGFEPASVLLKRILAERRRRWEEAELAKLKAKGKTPTDDRWKAKYEEPVAPDTTNLPELREGWCWASLQQLLSHLTSGSRDWTDYYDRGTGVFLMAQNVRPGRLDLSFIQHVDPPPDDASCARSQVEEGDLLVTIVGANTGDVCRVPRPLPEHYVCQSVALMRPVIRSLSRYLDTYLNSPPGQAVFDRFMYGQGRPHLGFEQLETTPVPLPPADEAERIVAVVDDKIAVAAAVAAPIGSNKSRIARLRQSILKWAFEGRLVEPDGTAPAGAATPR